MSSYARHLHKVAGITVGLRNKPLLILTRGAKEWLDGPFVIPSCDSAMLWQDCMLLSRCIWTIHWRDFKPGEWAKVLLSVWGFRAASRLSFYCVYQNLFTTCNFMHELSDIQVCYTHSNPSIISLVPLFILFFPFSTSFYFIIQQSSNSLSSLVSSCWKKPLSISLIIARSRHFLAGSPLPTAIASTGSSKLIHVCC